jgi:hypothetical protein
VWRGCSGELRADGIKGLRDLERARAADSVIGPRLDHEVSSSGGGGQTWQAQSMVQVLVDRVIEGAGDFDLDPSRRDSVTSEWAETLRRPVSPAARPRQPREVVRARGHNGTP